MMDDHQTIRCVANTCGDHDSDGPRSAVAGTMLCHRCAQRLEQHLAEIPARHDQLRAVIGDTGGRGTGRRGTPEPPANLNIPAHDLLGHLAAVVASWAAMVREERDLHGPDSDDLEPLSRWLLSQVDWIIRQPWVDDFEEELREASRTADVITGHRPLRHRLEPACPRCSARELGRDDGTAQVDCGSCGAAWDERMYPALVRLALDDSRGCITALEASERLGMSLGAFRNYVHRGRVRKLGTVDGQAQYSASDVDALLDETEESA